MVKPLMNTGKSKSPRGGEDLGLPPPLQVGPEEWKLQSRFSKICLVQGKHFSKLL